MVKLCWEELRERGDLRREEIVVTEKRWQEKIGKSRFNKWYG